MLTALIAAVLLVACEGGSKQFGGVLDITISIPTDAMLFMEMETYDEVHRFGSGREKIFIRSSKYIKDFNLIEVTEITSGEFIPGRTLWSVEELEPKKPLLVELTLAEFIKFGISLTEGEDVKYYYMKQAAGGALGLYEFTPYEPDEEDE
jgi:hypothetical protein